MQVSCCRIYIYIYASYCTTRHAILLQRIERGLWRYFYKTVRGPGAHATKLYGDFLLSLSLYNQTRMTTTTTMTAAAAAAAAAIFKYYHHSLITLSHPVRLRPLLLQSHATRSSFLSQPTEPKFPSYEWNFPPPHPHSWQHWFFQISRHFFQTYRREGKQVTWPGEVEGVILFLRKSSPPLI